MQEKYRVGLIGYGKAGQAVARVLQHDPRIELRWIVSRTGKHAGKERTDSGIPLIPMSEQLFDYFIDDAPIDALIDFSSRESMRAYGAAIARHQVLLVTAISAYTQDDIAYLHQLGKQTRILCSPNITLGINFLMIAATLLRRMAPFADVAILEQHFRSKPEISGTALKLADKLEINYEEVTALRLGGIVGQHEVIFGFPFQTLRLIHNSISREAFGTGAIFALLSLAKQSKNGFYTLDQLLLQQIQDELKEMA
jgi:4-hydroxy-tetrahydrodipicolinate reductase